MADDKKPKKTKKSADKTINFKFDGPDSNEPRFTTSMMAEQLSMSSVHMEANEAMQKSVEASKRMPLNQKVDKNKIAWSAHQPSTNGVVDKPYGRLDDDAQRELAQFDPYISAIISKRCTQAAVIGRAADNKWDKGIRLKDLNPNKREDFETEKEYKQASKKREIEMKLYLDWALHCGYYAPDFLNTVFYAADRTFKTCSLSDYIVAQTRNMLTFGRYARQVHRDESSIPVIFRPFPVETLVMVDYKSRAHIGRGDNTYPESIIDAEEFNALPMEDRPLAYVQMIDNRQENFFTELDMKVHYFQKQALFDLRGYPLSPIELAISMVFIHQQTLGHIRNQFIKGIATKSFITIKTTDPSYKLDDEALDELRRQFHNYILRTDNAAVTPILSGPIEVQVQSFHPTPRDMEFLQLEDHIIRSLCSSFQISPHEMGYGNLGGTGDGITQNTKEEEIIRGEEAGLRAILDVIFDDLNEIMCEAFEGFAENYRLIYTGVGEDTRDSVIQRSIAELQTTATMNSLYAESDKTEAIPYAGDVPLSAAFHQNALRYCKYSQFAYHFLKEEDALNNPAYDFIIDPQLNQAYQQLLVTPVKQQQEQSKLQNDSMMQQMQAQQQQMQAGAQQAQQSQPQDPNQAPPQEQPQEPVEKSLKDAYMGHAKDNTEAMHKSMEYYFSAWIKENEKD